MELKATKPTENLYFLAAAGKEITADGDHFVVDGKNQVKVVSSSGGKPYVRTTDQGQELILPIKFNNQTAKIEVEWLW